jgi:O-antigen ligase
MVIFVSLLVGSLASSVALAAAVVAGGIMFVAKSHGLRIIAIVSVAVTLSMPITLPVLLDFIDDNFIEYTADGKLAESTHYAGSITHRFLIWRFALEKINQHNVMGLGLDTSRNLPGGHTNLGEGRELMPLHPHNALLQIWLELGIPGLIIFAAGIWACYTAGQPGNQTILMQSARATTLVIILVIMASTFGAWQSWWNSTVIIAIASLGVWQRDKTN